MRLIVGLGNPGTDYENTRHNVGFEVVDMLAERRGISFDKLKAGWIRGKVGELAVDRDAGFALLKPLTFMNRSGDPVVEALKRFDVGPEAVFVVVDDLALPVGNIRIRREGSSGGHNGLKSIFDRLGTQKVPRLRLGIGEARGNTADYVLSRFSKQERSEMDFAVSKAVDALEQWLDTNDLDRCMSEFNKSS